MNKFFLTIALCGFMGAASAQGIKFGVTAGLNMSSLNISETKDVQYKVGYQAGVLLDLGITSNFSIIPELNFSQKGAKFSNPYEWDYDEEAGAVKAGTATATLTLNYLTLPVNAAYKFPLGEDQHLMLFAGPYLGYGISTGTKAKAKAEGIEVEVNMGDLFKFGSKEDEINPLDFGLNAGVGYQYSKVFLKFQYNLGLVSASNTKGDNIKNSNAALTAGFMF